MKANSVVLRVKDTTAVKNMVSFLKDFNKADLVEVLSPTISKLRKCEVTFTSDSSSSNSKLVRKLLKNGFVGFKKDDVISVYALLAVGSENVKNIAEAVMPEALTIWEAACRFDDVSDVYIKRVLGREIKIASTKSWNPRMIAEPLFAGMSIESSYSYYYSWDKQKIKGLFIPYCDRKKYVDVFIGPQVCNPPLVAELPAGEDLMVEGFEESIGGDVMYLNGVMMSGGILLPLGSISIVRLNALEKKLKTAGFVNEDVDEVRRAGMLAYAYAVFHNSSFARKGNGQKEFAKYLVDQFGNGMISSEFQVMLPRYKGFTKSFTEYSRAGKICRLVAKLLKSAGEGDGNEWLDMSEFMCRYLCNDDLMSKTAAFTFLFNPSDYRRKAHLKHANGSGNEVFPDLFIDLTFAFAVHYIKLLCAAGIIDMAVKKEVADEDPMEGIRFVRLTDLGRYAFGFSKNYEPKKLKDFKGFELEENALIVTILDKDSPYELFLSKIGKKIGGNRYNVTARSIVAASATTSDALLNIDNFKQLVCPEPQGIWLSMITEVYQRIAPKIAFDKSYVMLRLNHEAPGLIDFIFSNKEIRKHVLLAQDDYLLVEKDFEEKFNTMLHRAGYMF